MLLLSSLVIDRGKDYFNFFIKFNFKQKKAT